MSRKVSTVALPFSNVKLHSHKSVMKGSGNGSVLLRSGGPGAGSSYTDMDNYIKDRSMANAIMFWKDVKKEINK